MKLAIGTVQFGIRYGINNSEGIPGNAEIHNIFTVAVNAGISMIDTALGYGNAEERVSSFADIFNIVSKFSGVKTEEELLLQFETSFTHLGASTIYGYLAHNADNLIAIPELWQTLQKLKEESRVKKIGYSLYSVNQLESLLTQNMIPDLIQFPFNIFDQRFAPYMSELVSLGVEIHTRSVYLQGLLQMNPERLSNNLEQLKPDLIKLRDIAVQNNLSISELCLGFALRNPFINKVVIGIDNASQLAENIYISQKDSLSKEVIRELLSIKVTELNLLNPLNWD